MAFVEWLYSLPVLDRFFGAVLFAIIVFALWRSWLSLVNGRNIGYYRGFQSTPLYHLFVWIFVLPVMLPKIPGMIRARRQMEKRKETAPYIGNAKTSVVHKRGCEYEQKMSRIDDCRVPFDFIEFAIDSNYRPCNFCFTERDFLQKRPTSAYLLVREK